MSKWKDRLILGLFVGAIALTVFGIVCLSLALLKNIGIW